MTKRNTSIEINGKRYDAITGQPLTPAVSTAVSAASPRKAPSLTAATPKTAHAIAQHSSVSQRVKPSATLMRSAVKKPGPSLKQRTNVQSSTLQLVAAPTLALTPKRSLASVDPQRQARAASITLSSKIKRFGAADVVTKPSLPKTTTLAPKSIQQPKTPDIFERALAKATAHEQPPLPKKQLKQIKRAAHPTHRLFNYAAGGLAVLLLFGFLAYQNVANVTLKMAASKAGFAATLPGYRPSGFAVGKFSYSPGSVAINFHSNGDDRHFALLEKPSNWDSSTLLNNFVATTASANYQTMQAAGRTVYLYGQNDATWVNNGIWYQIHGDNALSNRDLTSLAASM